MPPRFREELCIIQGCVLRGQSRRMCMAHYQAWYRHKNGSPVGPEEVAIGHRGRKSPGRLLVPRVLNEDPVRKLIREVKDGQPCTDCGGLFPPCVLDFDHRPGEMKLFRVSQATSRMAAITEIAKCDLVCANCHRIRTSERRSR